MAMTVHRQSSGVDSDLAVTRSRVRRATIEAENFLHDLGAIPIMNSDSMGMGRIGELVRRTWQLASRRLADAAGEQPADNERVLRFLAKLTINPALTHGLADHVGSLEPGKLADIVLWHPAFFGAKPELVLKAGFVAWGVSGDGAGSTRLGQPRAVPLLFRRPRRRARAPRGGLRRGPRAGGRPGGEVPRPAPGAGARRPETCGGPTCGTMPWSPGSRCRPTAPRSGSTVRPCTWTRPAGYRSGSCITWPSRDAAADGSGPAAAGAETAVRAGDAPTPVTGGRAPPPGTARP